MMKCGLRVLVLALLACTSLPVLAQNDAAWKPTGQWPFINRHFRTASVYTGIFNRTKTVVPCNIHVGNQTLWYSQNDTLMEAVPGSIIRVEFANGDTYMPVGASQSFGRIVREDSIDGSIARVICVRSLNQRELDQKYMDYINKSQNLLQGATFNVSDIADTEAGRNIEEEPLPMVDQFYFQVKGEIFQARPKEILAHINPQRKKEYRLFNREAEIISTNESSILKVWDEFFLKR